MIVLKIKYKNNWYYVEQNNKEFKYYRIDGNNKDFNLNIDEVRMIKTAIDSITPSNIRINLTDYLYSGKKYEILYDPKTELRFFNPLPKLEILSELNMIFNNQSEYLYDNKVINKEKPKIVDTRPFYKRFADYKKEIITLLVSTTLLFQSFVSSIDLVTTTFYNNYESKIEQTVAMDDHEYINSFFNAIYINPYLSKQEKNYFMHYYSGDMLLDNKNYIDLDNVIYRLSNLKIIYSKKACPRHPSYAGAYSSFSNTITFYRVSSLNDVEDHTFTHEAYHVLSHDVSFYNSFLVETLNTQFNEEYTGLNDNNIYKKYIKYTNALAEIIGPIPLRKYKNYSVKKPIINALVDIYGTENDANKLLANLDNYKKIYDNYNERGLLDTDEAKKNLANLNEQLVDQIGTYYQAKYNRDYQDDLIMLFYLDKPKFDEILKEEYQIPEDTDVKQIKNASYFKNMDNELWFNYSGNNLIVIDEHSRYLNNNENRI